MMLTDFTPIIPASVLQYNYIFAHEYTRVPRRMNKTNLEVTTAVEDLYYSGQNQGPVST